jgi:hypothetical protein
MRVYRALDEALKRDRARPTIQKISELGLVEMTRKRTRDTLVRSLCEPCSHCEGRGYTKSHATVAYEILRETERLSVDRDAKKILISAHESVINILAIELRDALDQLERRYNKSVYLQSILEFHGEQFEVVTDRMQGKKQSQDIARQLRMERERSERKEKVKQRKNENHSHRNSPESEREPARHSEPQENKKAQPQLPVTRPTGSFIAAKAPSNPPVPVPQQAAPSEAPLVEDEDRQPDFAPAQVRQEPSQNFSDMDDEDQLAYLRAQAAQDAAIASLGQPSASPSQGGNQRYNRGQNFRNQGQQGNHRNQRNPQQNHKNRNRHGQQNQQQRGGRFRPQHAGNGNIAHSPQTMESKPSRSNSFVEEGGASDYEGMSRQGDGSES